MWGAVLPDAPLLFVGLFNWLQTICEYVGLSFVARMDALYFDSAGFIALHHVLHSPTSLALLLGCWVALQHLNRMDFRGFWFLCGAVSHSLVDIFTHAQDGILVFWPLNWSYRYNSGLDQWNLQGTGLWLAALEVVFVVGYGGFFLWKAARPTINRVSANSSEHSHRRTIRQILGRSSNNRSQTFNKFLWVSGGQFLALVYWCRSKCWCDARAKYQQQ